MQLDVCGIEFAADEFPTEIGCNLSGRAAPNERIKYYAAGAAAGENARLD